MLREDPLAVGLDRIAIAAKQALESSAVHRVGLAIVHRPASIGKARIAMHLEELAVLARALLLGTAAVQVAPPSRAACLVAVRLAYLLFR